jgi:hypothetical protein
MINGLNDCFYSLEKPVFLAQSIRLVPKSVVLTAGMRIYALRHWYS